MVPCLSVPIGPVKQYQLASHVEHILGWMDPTQKYAHGYLLDAFLLILLYV